MKWLSGLIMRSFMYKNAMTLNATATTNFCIQLVIPGQIPIGIAGKQRSIVRKLLTQLLLLVLEQQARLLMSHKT
ncbi:Uncharacterised protein [Vibrio cholerae]|nr:Uncharacterised protein [Vibrio cholerae]